MKDDIRQIELMFIANKPCPFTIKMKEPGIKQYTRDCYPTARAAAMAAHAMIEGFFDAAAECAKSKSGQSEQAATQSSRSPTISLSGSSNPGGGENKITNVQNSPSTQS
ncbi:MAG: hypothetical protein WBK76_00570 [Candidatus Saccharimonadales bacterium]